MEVRTKLIIHILKVDTEARDSDLCEAEKVS